MKKIIPFLLLGLFFLPVSSVWAQNDYVPVSNPVYKFLYNRAVLGELPDYNLSIIPKTRREINNALQTLAVSSDSGRVNGRELKLFLSLFSVYPDSVANGINPNLFLSGTPAHPFYYTDSIVSAYLDSRLSAEYISFSGTSGGMAANLFTYGADAVIHFPYSITIFASAWNGSVYGNRTAASKDFRVARSFSFNKTKLNNFDGTEGYISFQNKFLSLQFGRDKLIRGAGYINPARFGYNRPMFDFIRALLTYKQFSYEFVHGWLNEEPVLTDLAGINYKTKVAKYLASSMAMWRPSDVFSVSMSQTIIYSERGLEAAYLNPFLMWESAQRSLNDVDNSYLSLELSYLPVKGIRVYGQLLMDDINFNVYNKEGFNSVSNMGLYQAGITYTSPALPITCSFEFMEIRPFVFSHPGHANGLSYTNNGEGLGVQYQPNSRVFSCAIDWSAYAGLSGSVYASYYLHGRNRYDAYGKRIENVGGDILVSYDLTNSRIIPTLAGEREETVSVGAGINYLFSYNLSAGLSTLIEQKEFRGKTTEVTTQLRLKYGYR